MSSITARINIFLVLVLVYATCTTDSKSTHRSLPNVIRYFDLTYHEDDGGIVQIENRETSCPAIKRSGVHCPYHRNYQGEANNNFYSWPLKYRSTSPWVFIVRENPKHQPSSEMWACCACISCVSRHPNGTFTQDPNRYSYPIIMKKQVMDLTKDKDIQQEVPVGCTCGEPEQN